MFCSLRADMSSTATLLLAQMPPQPSCATPLRCFTACASSEQRKCMCSPVQVKETCLFRFAEPPQAHVLST